jgi:serine/threonine protein kinase
MFENDRIDSLKIIDFGVSAKFQTREHELERFAGTAVYMSPE